MKLGEAFNFLKEVKKIKDFKKYLKSLKIQSGDGDSIWLDNYEKEKRNPKEVIPELLKSKQWKGFTCKKINDGLCDDFQLSIWRETGGHMAETIAGGYLENNHFFIKWKNKYYDSETPNGVIDYTNLPWFKREIKKYNEKL